MSNRTRLLRGLLALALLAGPAAALELGDPAPAINVDWLRGGPYTLKDGKGKNIFVLEFWATWCGPCRISIPKLTELQEKFPDKKLTVIGVSVDQGGLETVKTFVGKMGPKMGYTVALDAGGTMANYMAAVQRNGIPYAFVIDTSGKLCWHGHPADALELVATEAAAGTFDPKKHADRAAKFLELDAKYSQHIKDKDWDGAEKTLDEIVKVRPDLTGNLLITRYSILSGGRNNLPGALAYARKIADNELKNDPENLIFLADKIVGAPGLSAPEQQWATELAKRAVDLTKSRNPTALVIYSEALKREGKFDQAIAAAQQAADITDEPMEKKYYAGRIDELKQAKDAAAKPPSKP
jgi:thiol-disulfide isomerase/thioredoxin